MVPYPYARPEVARVIMKSVWQDLNLSPEEGVRLGPIVDAPPLEPRPARVAALRRRLGAALVHAGELIQGASTAAQPR